MILPGFAAHQEAESKLGMVTNTPWLASESQDIQGENFCAKTVSNNFELNSPNKGLMHSEKLTKAKIQ